MANKAQEILIPGEGVFRTVFLNVGQGDSTLLIIPDGTGHKYVLTDSHQDDKKGSIDIIKLLEDLLEGQKRKLDIYINTHPHKDHLGKVKEMYENKKIGIKQVWHSGHKPGGDHKDAYKDLEYVMEKVGKENVFQLKGSREDNKLDDKEVKLGDISFNILAPADYVTDEIEDEKPEDRYHRIHEQCGVIRFKYGKKEKQILLTGDADYDAWTKHITDYHKDRLPAHVLSAVHHGSNTFFWKGDPKDEDPYTEHLDKIDPKLIVVSAPARKDSPHGHPDKEAMGLYEDKVGKDNLKHLGDKPKCIIVDIDSEGNIDIQEDYELIKEYPSGDDNKDEDKENGGQSASVIYSSKKQPSKPWLNG